MSAKDDLILADAEVRRLRATLVKLAAERAEDIDLLQHKPTELAAYEATEQQLRAELAMAEHNHSAALAAVSASDAARSAAEAKKIASHCRLLAVLSVLCTAGNLIYNLLKH